MKSAAELFESLAFVRLDERLVAPLGTQFTNPSIHPSGERRVVVRTVNYRIVAPHRYAIADADRVVRSTSCAVELDDDLRPHAPHAIVDRSGTDHDRFDIRGFEDCRVFSHAGQEYAVAAARSGNPAGVAQQFLLRLDGHSVAAAWPLSQPAEGHHKNWMPVIGAPTMTFVDRCAPLRLRTFDPKSGAVDIVDVDSDVPEARSYRGGSQVIRAAGRWLAAIHEVSAEAGARAYRHRFVAFDEHLRPVAATDAFSFVGSAIEFCAGLRCEGGELIASFGVGDAEAWLARLALDEVVAALRPLSGPRRAATMREAPTQSGSRAGIVSVTLAHAGREAPLQDALASVRGWVDRCLVVDTSGDPAIHAAAAQAVGEQLVAAEWPWTGDFGAARSAALELAAARTCAAWAVVVDSDETIVVDPAACPEGVRAALERVPPDVHSLTTWNSERTYTKVRFFRLPAEGRYVGVTHEYFERAGRAEAPLAGVTFSERPKDAAELAAKAARDIALLRRATARHPRDGRWWYYLGDALEIGGQPVEAVAAFRRCTDVDTWGEQAAWAAFREAQLWVRFGDHDRAVERCAAGLARHPPMAELAWYAGYAAYHGGRYRDAAAFANLAIVHGEYLGLAGEAQRTLFRHRPALYEGPFDVLRFAYRALGDQAAADRAEADHQAALAARLAAAPPTASTTGSSRASSTGAPSEVAASGPAGGR